MDYDLFLNLYKYRETEGKTAVENFLTEIFAYIFKMIISQDEYKDTAIKLLKLFDIEISKKNLKKTTIETQCEYYVDDYKRKAIPDIKIRIDNEVYFIENKVESDLIQYPDGSNQILLYEKIKLNTFAKNRGVRTLTKYDVNVSIKSNKYKYLYFNSKKHKVFWRNIYSFFKNETIFCNNILIRNFLSYLGDNDMEERQILSLSEEGLKNYYSLYSFLKDILFDYFKSHGYNIINFDGNKNYFGFGIYFKNNLCVRIGCYNNSNIFVAECLKNNYETIKNKKSVKKAINDYKINPADSRNKEMYILTELNLSDILNKKVYAKQEKIFKDWLDSIIEISDAISNSL